MSSWTAWRSPPAASTSARTSRNDEASDSAGRATFRVGEDPAKARHDVRMEIGGEA